MKKILIAILLLIIFSPFNVFADYDSTKYYNLVFPSTIETDLSSNSSVYLGGTTTLKDFIDDISSVSRNGRKLVITLKYSASALTGVVVSALEIGSMPYYQVYGTINGLSLSTKEYFYNDLTVYNYTFTPCSTGGSILESEIYNNIKNCLINNTCATTKPNESTFNCSYTANTSKTIANTSFNMPTYDSSVEVFDVNYRIIPYFSDLSITYNEKTGTDNLNRKLKIDNTFDIGVGDLFPTYLDFINQPTPDPGPEPTPDPDNPDVGVWKDYVFWFFDNDSEYGVLVNIYILLFITIIWLSIIIILKRLR